MFAPGEISTFRFISYEFDEETGNARFHYAFDTDIHFTEQVTFPIPRSPLTSARRAALDRTLFLLSLAAGVTYYKAAIPPVAVVESGPVSKAEIEWLRELFFEGLGEFAYVNRLNLRDRPEFRYAEREHEEVDELGLSRCSLVAVGGGKDSCVTIEALRRSEEPLLLASVNEPNAIVAVKEMSGLPSTHAGRAIAPELFDLNAQGALNGHVPITAIVSLILAATAILRDCNAVVMSNERSASSGNVEWDGRIVNHQYSKSIDAERATAALLRDSVAPDLQYFSLLRPLSELEIARRFASSTRYDGVFTSCNAAFRIDTSRRVARWCGSCPKCRFVFLAMAPFMSRSRLTAIFEGKNLFDDGSQAAGFDALIGWNAFKPFECVGEVEESIAAFLLVEQSDEWRGSAIVRRFSTEVLPGLTLPDDILQRPFQVSPDHDVPPEYYGLLNEAG